ncbi:unnamed protein product [Rotaria magnacalcarata]|uniref:Fe2OG dioxygenase domain-containing protein n=1 Tax=Rotaria magnacalcarata TaxID=392030 RepID=A0A8S2L425_9BILA|nr:unnamed protein product [Rotaria magnacalcarata]CAF3885130.1 unnamed protein product [Rotaria magnacalcarata]CAF3979570.1 unnamed protein product [Rotaria magnacalcarata]
MYPSGTKYVPQWYNIFGGYRMAKWGTLGSPGYVAGILCISSDVVNESSLPRGLVQADHAQDQLSCGAHTDDNGVTLLMQQEGVCGLQVKNGQGEWIDAVPIHGTIVVNIGDLVERWSNGHFKATEHRVLMQPGVERYSAIVFHTPDYHATIECCVKDEIPKYPAIIAGDFIKNRGEAHSKPLDQWTDNEQNLISAEEYSLKLRADVNQKH